MSTIQQGRFVRTDLWREGEWFDMWSIVHLLSGTSVGLCFYFVHVGSITLLVLALVVLIVYEVWEAVVQIGETLTNRIMDVVVGLVGYSLAFFVIAPKLSVLWVLVILGLVVTLDIVMSIFGWRASQKATELKKRMYARLGIIKI